jgi:predicted nucleotidyltransferase component of viral defense system
VTYATPEAFRQALEARIRKASREREQPIARVRQLLVFDRFLARVFAVLGDRAIVKGGTALELRLARARTTNDIDLRVTGGSSDLLDVLRRACELDCSDFLSFAIDTDPEHPEIEGDGIVYEGRRYRAEARLAGRIYGDRFGVDAGFGDVLTTAVEVHQGTDFLAFADIAPTQYRVYPREAHVAEKLHAYTLPRKRENTRVKDLPDLALLATTGSFDAVALRGAIEATFAFRKTHAIPASLPEPPSSWTPIYANIAGRDELPWQDLEAVTAAARAFLNPVLAGESGTWDLDAWQWMVP